MTRQSQVAREVLGEAVFREALKQHHDLQLRKINNAIEAVIHRTTAGNAELLRMVKDDINNLCEGLLNVGLDSPAMEEYDDLGLFFHE